MDNYSNHKAGFVSIIGNANVGKSTLMNRILGQKFSIITQKHQTTRHRIKGILNEADYQIVFSDTPGILKPVNLLHEKMMSYVKEVFEDSDILIIVTDIFEDIIVDEKFLEKIKKINLPKIVLINKIDLAKDMEIIESKVQNWIEILPESNILPISAQRGDNVDFIMNKIKELLPLSPPYFDKNDFTDKSTRFFVSEIIREKIFLNYSKEIPYSSQVEIDEYLEEENIVKIRAKIYVERDSQKHIIIGNKGLMLKKIGTEARLDIESFIGNKVFLKFHVLVDKDWKSNNNKLDKFGY